LWCKDCDDVGGFGCVDVEEWFGYWVEVVEYLGDFVGLVGVLDLLVDCGVDGFFGLCLL